jgi:hypothetical protein
LRGSQLELWNFIVMLLDQMVNSVFVVVNIFLLNGVVVEALVGLDQLLVGGLVDFISLYLLLR